MQALFLAGEHACGFGDHLRGLFFTFGVDDLGTPRAFGFGLLCDRADHAFVEVDVFDFDVGHLDTPVVGALIQDLLDVGVELVALRQHVVELVLAEHRTQGRLGELAGGFEHVCNPDDGLFRIDDAEVDHRVDPYRDVVLGDHVLGRHIQYHDTQIDFGHFLQERD